MKNFKELKIWQHGMDLVEQVYQVCQELPDQEKYGLISQLKRAAISIPSNIAEGASRDSSKENYYYLQIALGSLFELETQILLAKRLKYTCPESTESLIDRITEERKMLYGFMKRIRESTNSR